MTTTLVPTSVPVTGESRVARRGAAIAAVGASAWFALAGDSIARPEAQSIRDLFMVVPWALLGLTLFHVHHLNRLHVPRWAHLSARVLAVGMILAGVGAFVSGVGGTDAGRVLMGLGMAPFVVGLVATGVATARAGVLRRSTAWAIALSQGAAVATGVALSPLVPLEPSGSYSGGLAHAVVLMFVAIDLVELADRSG